MRPRMKKFKVTLMIPQETVIEAADLQAAHNQVSSMMKNQKDPDTNPAPKVHSIIEVEDPSVMDFGPSPAA